jgi:hypothetical protein
LVPITAVLVIAAVTSGCGDSDDASSSAGTIATSPLSKAEFIKKATAACGRESKGVVQKAAGYLKKLSAKKGAQPVLEAKAVKVVLVPVIEAKNAAVRKLGAPAGDEERIEAMLANQQETVEEVKELKRIEPGDNAVYLFVESDKEFEDYNLTKCSSKL